MTTDKREFQWGGIIPPHLYMEKIMFGFLGSWFRQVFDTNVWRYISVASVTVAMGYMLSSSTAWWWATGVSGWILVFMFIAIVCGGISLLDHGEQDSKVVPRLALVTLMCGILTVVSAKGEKETYAEISGPLLVQHQQELIAKQNAEQEVKEEKAKVCAVYVAALNKLSDEEKVAVLRVTGAICNY